MPRRSVPLRRVPSLWVLLAAWRMWRRLPPPVRRRITREARARGPQAVRAVQRAVRDRAGAPKR